MQITTRFGTSFVKALVFAVLNVQCVVGHFQEKSSGKQEVIYFMLLAVKRGACLE